MTTAALENRGSPGQRVLVGTAAGVLIVAGMRLAAPVLVPVAFALFLAVLAHPLLQILLRRRVPVTLAVSAVMLVLAAVATIFIALLLGSLAELREAGPIYYAGFQERISYTLDWWQGKGISVLDWIPAKYTKPDAIVEFAGRSIKGIFALASQITIVLLTLVFILVEAASLPKKLERLPERYRAAFERVSPVSRELQRYLVIKTAMSLAIGLVAGSVVALLGVDFAVLCGMVAFACHFIPNVGALLAAAPPMALAFVQYDLAKSLTVLVAYLVIGTVLGNLLEPALLGQRLGLSTLVVFLSLLFWGWLWGPIGMLLSVPLTGAIKILLERSRSFGWLATLLSSTSPRAVPPPESEGDTVVSAVGEVVVDELSSAPIGDPGTGSS